MSLLQILGKIIFQRYSKLVGTLFLIFIISLFLIFAWWSIFLSVCELCGDLFIIFFVSQGPIGIQSLPFHHILTFIVSFILKNYCQSFIYDLHFSVYYHELEKLSQTRDSFYYSVYVILDDYIINNGYELYVRILMGYLAIWGLIFFYFASEFFFDFLESFF